MASKRGKIDREEDDSCMYKCAKCGGDAFHLRHFASNLKDMTRSYAVTCLNCHRETMVVTGMISTC